MNRKMAWGASALVLAACGGGGDPMVMVMTDAGPGDGGRDMPDRPMMVSDDSFEGARTITTDGTEQMQAIERPGDVDFYRFEGMAGQWVVIYTDANADDDPMMIDTVLTLYDSSRTQIAENDDSVPRINVDSEIFIRLPSTGTYYVRVQEWSSWQNEMPFEGGPSFMYALGIVTVMDTGPFNIDAEAGDDAASAQMVRYGGTSGNAAWVMGSFDDATDVDVWRVVMTGTNRTLNMDVMPAGTDAYGSTRAPAEVRVTDMTGTTTIARIRPRDRSQSDISPPLPPGTYLVWVDAGGGTAGSNDHYVIKAPSGDDNTPEMEMTAGANDTAMTAEAATTMDVMGVTRAFILSRLSTVSDVDYYSFTVPMGMQISAFCRAESSGSGVQGLSVQIIGSDGMAVLGTGTETATDGATVMPVTVPAAGTYYLRLSKTGQAADVAGDYVRCGVAIATPAAP